MDRRITIGYTIHNKAHLIPQIIEGLKKSFSPEEEYIFLFDNCTDNSIKVFDKFKHKPMDPYRTYKSKKDLFEIKANNFLLKEAATSVVILFQDDIIANDPKMKEKILNILDNNPNHGLLGARSGFDLEDVRFPETPVRKYSNWEHKPEQIQWQLKEGKYEKRTFLNRGPIVFTRDLINKVGYLNEDYFPQWGDDLDYCARAKFKHGLENIVFECKVESKLEWGSMRKKDSNLRKLHGTSYIKRNWNRFIADYGEYLK